MRKQNRRTNTKKAWGYQEQRKVCNTTCMCIPDSRYGLTLAWVTSENSTMLLESDILRLFFTGPYLVSSPLCSVSGVDCPSVLPRQLLLFASLLSSRNSFCCLPLCSPATNSLSPVQPPTPLLVFSHQLPLSGSRRQLSFSGPATNSHSRVQPPTLLSWSPATNCLSLGCVVNSHSRVQPPTLILGSSHQLSSLLSNYQLPLLGSSHQLSLLSLLPPTLLLLSNYQLPLLGSSHQLSLLSLLPPTLLRVPLPLPDTARFFLSKNPLSGFAPKQTIESSALTAPPHSATVLSVFESPCLRHWIPNWQQLNAGEYISLMYYSEL